MERAFERIKPGEDPPPPPPELLQWARETTYGLCGGIVYGAASAHYAERRRVDEGTKREERSFTKKLGVFCSFVTKNASFVVCIVRTTIRSRVTLCPYFRERRLRLRLKRVYTTRDVFFVSYQ